MFDYVYVALDEKHYEKFKKEFGKTFPKVGILVFNGKTVQEKKFPIKNENVNLYPLLWAKEVKTLAWKSGAPKKTIRNEEDARSYLEKHLTCFDLKQKSRRVFVERFVSLHKEI